MNTNKSSRMSTMALLLFCFILYAQNAMGSIVQTLIDAFPVSAATGRLAVTLPCLGSCITALFAGFFAGTRVKYRTIFIITCICWTVGGMMPIYFHDSFTVVLFGRFIFGLGTGLGLASNAYIVAYYPPAKKAKMLGLALAFNNGGSIMFQLVGGWLGEIGWIYPFFLYLICPVVLIVIALFLKEPAKAGLVTPKEHEAGKKISLRAVLFLVITIINGIMVTSMNAGTSTIVADWSLGGSFIAGVILTAMTIGGTLAGCAVQKTQKLGRFAVSLMLLLAAGGYFISLCGRSVILLCAGALFTGFGYYSIKPLFALYLSNDLSAKSVTLFTTLLYAGSNLGIFFSNSWISFMGHTIVSANTEMEAAYIGSMIVFGIVMAVFLVFNPCKSTNLQRQECIKPRHT